MKGILKFSIPYLLINSSNLYAVDSNDQVQLNKEQKLETTEIVSKQNPIKEKEFISSIESARVISCAVQFPNDSVKFSEEHVTNCIKSANMEHVSYIHIIATASSTGTDSHNLFLSTRRAGAIEAYLNNRYPNVQIHAFGGGENPKFGKVARIFLVENNKTGEEIAPGVQVASLGAPEVIEKIRTQIVTKTEYIEQPKKGLYFNIDGGSARSDLSSNSYQYLSVQVEKQLSMPIIMLDDFLLGIRYKNLKSDYVSDISSVSLTLNKIWSFQSQINLPLYLKYSLEGGQIQVNEKKDGEYGTSLTLGYDFKDIKAYTVLSYSNHIRNAGLGIVANL